MKRVVLVTSGGTAEPIDKVRKITNMSTGRLGAKIAEQLLNNYYKGPGIHVIYVHSKGAVLPNHTWSGSDLTLIQASSTQEVYDALKDVLTTQKVDAVIHSMAISDYTVDYLTTTENVADLAQSLTDRNNGVADIRGQLAEKLTNSYPDTHKLNNSSKVSSYEDGIMIKLKRTPKIISMIKEWNPDTMLVGFKLLNGVPKEDLIQVATDLLNKNRCSYVVANDLTAIGASGHKAYLVSKDGIKAEFETKAKIAHGLADLIADD